MLQELLQELHDTPLADTIRANALAFPWLESIHVLAITLVLGSIAVVDLRLLGLASVNRPVSTLIRQVLSITWIAFAIGWRHQPELRPHEGVGPFGVQRRVSAINSEAAADSRN